MVWRRIKSLKNKENSPEIGQIEKWLSEIHRLLYLASIYGFEL